MSGDEELQFMDDESIFTLGTHSSEIANDRKSKYASRRAQDRDDDTTNQTKPTPPQQSSMNEGSMFEFRSTRSHHAPMFQQSVDVTSALGPSSKTGAAKLLSSDKSQPPMEKKKKVVEILKKAEPKTAATTAPTTSERVFKSLHRRSVVFGNEDNDDTAGGIDFDSFDAKDHNQNPNISNQTVEELRAQLVTKQSRYEAAKTKAQTERSKGFTGGQDVVAMGTSQQEILQEQAQPSLMSDYLKALLSSDETMAGVNKEEQFKDEDEEEEEQPQHHDGSHEEVDNYTSSIPNKVTHKQAMQSLRSVAMTLEYLHQNAAQITAELKKTENRKPRKNNRHPPKNSVIPNKGGPTSLDVVKP
eukprot:PhF_6_TR1418/c1_g1_i1/m.2488